MIKLSPVNDTCWEVLEDYVYEGRYESWTVPAGLITDLASVPKFLWAFIGPYGSHLRAALVHDYLWSLARKGEFSYADANGIFRRILRESGVSPSQYWLMWSAVTVASPKSWKENPKDFVKMVTIALPGLVAVAPFVVLALWTKIVKISSKLVDVIIRTVQSK